MNIIKDLIIEHIQIIIISLYGEINKMVVTFLHSIGLLIFGAIIGLIIGSRLKINKYEAIIEELKLKIKSLNVALKNTYKKYR